MSFFDSKEEVINIELTSYGKKLLSQGKFKPAYYAFFDDDIIYDSNYANFSEEQNSTQVRILDETAFLKPMYNFHGLDNKKNENNITEFGRTNNDPLKIITPDNETEFSIPFPLGQSSFNSQYYPAWSLNILNGHLSSSQQFIDNTTGDSFIKSPYLRVPQINMESASIKIDVYNEQTVQSSQALQQSLLSVIQKGEKTFYIKRGDVFNLFDVVEKNVEDKKENFELEVFIEEEKIENGLAKKEWRKLNFPKKLLYINNGILLDEPLNKEAQDLTYDKTFAHHYLNILIDDEINLPPEHEVSINTYDSAVTNADRPFGEDC